MLQLLIIVQLLFSIVVLTPQTNEHRVLSAVIAQAEEPIPTETSAPTTEVTHVASPSEKPAESPVASPTVSPTESPSAVQVTTVHEILNPNEEVHVQAVDEAKDEEKKVLEVADPDEQTKLLVNMADDKVKDIDTSVKSDNFADTNFASQRLSDHLDRLIENLAKAPETKKDLVSLCKTVDETLRTAQLEVPEEAEQDLEINRAKCLEYNP